MTKNEGGITNDNGDGPPESNSARKRKSPRITSKMPRGGPY